MADIDLSLTVARLVEEFRKAGGSPSGEALNRLGAQIALAFGSKKDEVAILRLSEDAKMLRFVFPIKLQKIGSIPLTTAHSLATKTIRDRRGEIVNNFSVYKHPTVFEAVDLSSEEKATPIQKIISAPMVAEGKVVGVLQVSHKGRPGEPVGADFTPRDLTELTSVGTILGQYFVTLPFAPPPPQKPHPTPPPKT
ncbi:MAG: GAF domain-containing protein [Acidobacteriia bacterium]|nr:GAF domain-containing protein [Terriglobia bacterium]